MISPSIPSPIAILAIRFSNATPFAAIHTAIGMVGHGGHSIAPLATLAHA
ncbi:hypothetical protein [Mesorhizobium sp. B2-1-3A]|nr:hypothetical protein [Mesorhizobium sp. B2-1-3A]